MLAFVLLMGCASVGGGMSEQAYLDRLWDWMHRDEEIRKDAIDLARSYSQTGDLSGYTALAGRAEGLYNEMRAVTPPAAFRLLHSEFITTELHYANGLSAIARGDTRTAQSELGLAEAASWRMADLLEEFK